MTLLSCQLRAELCCSSPFRESRMCVNRVERFGSLGVLLDWQSYGHVMGVFSFSVITCAFLVGLFSR